MTKPDLKELWTSVLAADEARDEHVDTLIDTYHISEEDHQRLIALNAIAERASFDYYQELKRQLPWYERIAFFFGRFRR